MPPKKRATAAATAEAVAQEAKVLELLKRMQLGYRKRTAALEDTPLQAVEDGLRKAIRDNVRWQHLVIDGAPLALPLGASRLDPLVTALQDTGYPFLTSLQLWNVTLRSIDCQWLAKYLTQRKDLQRLDFLKVTIPDHGYGVLGEGLGFNVGVKELLMEYCPMSQEALHLFLFGLGQNDYLQRIKLARCGLIADCAEGLASYIARTVIQEVNLDGNSLGALGLARLAPALSQTTSLRELSLQENGIDLMDGGKMTVTEALGILSRHLLMNKTLQHLDLGSNTIGDEGGEIILDTHRQRRAKGLRTMRITVGHRMSSALYTRLMAIGQKAPAKKKKKSKKAADKSAA